MSEHKSIVRRIRAKRPLGPALALLLPLALIALLFGVGVDLPGPKIREKLGLSQGRADVKPCVPSPREDRTPSDPPPAGGAWTLEPKSLLARDELRAAVLDSRVYLANGHDSKVRSITAVEVFDPQHGRFRRAPYSPQPVDHATLNAHDGRLYLAGGFTNLIAGRTEGAPTRRLWSYSPATKHWTELAHMDGPRWGHAAEVIGDKLYVAGGMYGREDQLVREMQIYDFKRRRWTEGPPIPTTRHHVASAVIDGRMYVIGGRRPGNYALDVVERYDPVSRKWGRAAPLPQGAGGPAAVSVGGKLIVIGGGDDLAEWVTGAVWEYEPDSDSWRRLPNLKVPRHGHAAAAVNDRIYVFGGAPCALFGKTDVTESLRLR